MKWLSILLAVLVLGLSVQPSCAALSGIGECATAQRCCGEEAPLDHESSSKKDCTGCNPFHNCSCCTAGIVVPAFVYPTAEVLPQPEAKHFAGYPAHRVPLVAFDFWQPPRA